MKHKFITVAFIVLSMAEVKGADFAMRWRDDYHSHCIEQSRHKLAALLLQQTEASLKNHPNSEHQLPRHPRQQPLKHQHIIAEASLQLMAQIIMQPESVTKSAKTQAGNRPRAFLPHKTKINNRKLKGKPLFTLHLPPAVQLPREKNEPDSTTHSSLRINDSSSSQHPQKLIYTISSYGKRVKFQGVIKPNADVVLYPLHKDDRYWKLDRQKQRDKKHQGLRCDKNEELEYEEYFPHYDYQIEEPNNVDSIFDQSEEELSEESSS